MSLPCSATTETWCGGTQPYTVRITDTIGKPMLGVASTTDYERFGYDKNGNKTSWRRRKAQNKYYSYDSLNRVVHENGTTGPDIYTSYDLQGHVCDKISTTDTVSSGNDCNARMTAVTTAGIHNSYDKAGRLLSTKDANARVVSYTYNEASQRTSMTYPDSVVEGYQYNVDGSLKWAGVNATTLGMTAGYDARGRLITVTRSNGANSLVGYDDMSRVLTLKHTVTNTAYNADWAFIYNPASQVTKVTAPAAYEYIETVTSGYHPSYDGLNRDAGVANLTTTCGVDGDGYDCNGNLTIEGVGGRKFTYDIDNRLLTSTGGSAPATLAYDPTGRLSSYTAGSLTTQFLYDGVNLIAEYQGGVIVKRYMHTTGTDQPFVEFTGTGTAPSNAKFLLANYQGSIIALADSTGTVNLADVYKYGPYGEPVNNASTTTWGGERFRYTGQIVLPEAQLYYYKARVYDPKYGRFLQTDPVGSKDDLDLYAYVGGDPINHSDPTGLICTNDTKGGTTHCVSDGQYDVTFKTPKGFKNTDPNAKDYHQYDVNAHSSKDANTTREWVKDNPVPAPGASPATPGGTTNNAAGAFAPVTSYTAVNQVTGNEVVVNVTAPGHPLGNGIVVRDVTSNADGSSTIRNMGEGNGVLQQESTLLGRVGGAIINNGAWGGHTPGDTPAESGQKMYDFCTVHPGAC